ISTPAFAGGWYLMAPPINEIKVQSIRNWIRDWAGMSVPPNERQIYQRTDYEAPLSKWVQQGQYETLAECQQVQYRQHEQGYQDDQRHQNDGWTTTMEQHIAELNRINFDGALESSECVFAGDPRLR